MTLRTLYTGSIGMNNIVVPHELPYDKETGVAALEQSNDVLISQAGKIVTGRGTVKQFSGDFHSRFNLSDGSFYAIERRVSDSVLWKFVPNADGSLERFGIISGLSTTSKMDFVELGDQILYCDGHQNGVLKNDVSSQWTNQIWTGPESDIEMVKPPVGTHIDVFSGRALLSVKDELFYSEHGLIGLIDETKNRVRLESDVFMIYAVQTGIYVSDNKSVYFLSGQDPSKWNCKKVLNYPATEWGREQGLVNPSKLGLNTFEMSALFATINGPVIGLPDGTPVNLIDNNLIMPDCGLQSGSIMVVDKTTIIQSGV